ncbi:MAG: hypothetical protein C4341_08850 [Armatimonadota bacterium]
MAGNDALLLHGAAVLIGVRRARSVEIHAQLPVGHYGDAVEAGAPHAVGVLHLFEGPALWSKRVTIADNRH